MLQRDEAGDEEGVLGKWFKQGDDESGGKCGSEHESPSYFDQYHTAFRVQSGCAFISLLRLGRQSVE